MKRNNFTLKFRELKMIEQIDNSMGDGGLRGAASRKELCAVLYLRNGSEILFCMMKLGISSFSFFFNLPP